jgi:hypothetical protein
MASALEIPFFIRSGSAQKLLTDIFRHKSKLEKDIKSLNKILIQNHEQLACRRCVNGKV